MNSSAINSILPFNHSSSASGLLSVNEGCRFPDYLGVVLYAVYVISLFMGYPANIMVLWLVARKEIDSSTSDVFFVNLAILDAFYSLIMPLNHLSVTILNQGVNFHFLSFIFAIKNSSPLLLTCICLDRYMAVVHPIVFSSIKDNKIRVAMSMLVWLVMIAYGFMRIWMKYYSGMFFTGMILTINIIMVFCNISIMRNLRKSVLGKEKINPMKKESPKNSANHSGHHSVSLLACSFVHALFYLIENKKNICAINFIVSSIMELSCSFEPLLCISKDKQLTCINNLPCICCRSPPPEPHKVST